MHRKCLTNPILTAVFIFSSTLAASAEPTEPVCAQLLKTTAYPGLAEDQNDEIIKQLKDAEKNMGSCAALSMRYKA